MVAVPMSDVEEALAKAARLRRDVEGLDPRPRKRRSLAGKTFSFVTRSVASLVVVVLATDALFAYRVFHDDPAQAVSSSAEGPTYSDLQIYEDQGYFAGRVSTTNPFAKDIDLYVTVDLYDGDQQVGEVFGHVTLKPNSSSVLELDGLDSYVNFTESRVHVSGWPNPVS